MVTTHAATLVMGPSGWAPLCCLGLPPGRLNALYATYEKCPNVDSPWQNGQSPHKQHRCSSCWKWLIACIMCRLNPSNQSNSEIPPRAPQGQVGTSPHPQAWPPYLQAWDTFYISLYRHLQVMLQSSGCRKAD